jgi:predicted RNase H-like HicB family nuclease
VAQFETFGASMTISDDISVAVERGDTPSPVDVNVLFREFSDDSGDYVVAECVEIPGCVSQGSTQAEAEANIKDAIKSCLIAMYVDGLKKPVDSN